jgi:hypothetical protein
VERLSAEHLLNNPLARIDALERRIEELERAAITSSSMTTLTLEDYDGTPPTPSGGATLFADDGEMKAIDEDGNVSTLT